MTVQAVCTEEGRAMFMGKRKTSSLLSTFLLDQLDKASREAADARSVADKYLALAEAQLADAGEYKRLAALTTNDGIGKWLESMESRCRASSLTHAENASCVMTIRVPNADARVAQVKVLVAQHATLEAATL